ncbi:MAG: hypothetical protein BWY09_02789 [Candidatus Hydrogenedentes bacterium ADurb.Bin179]|nr:MAG: hypothetical protein BWY09_02789 [Candidatus Hydrogenedentes bacterium ADurb.Bin179]
MVARLDVIIRADSALLAYHGRFDGVAADACGKSLLLDVAYGFMEYVDLACLHQPVRYAALQVQGICAVLDGRINICNETAVFLVHLDHGLHGAARGTQIFFNQGQLMTRRYHGVDAGHLRNIQGFEYLGFRIVGFKKIRHIDQVAGVGVPADEVAAENKPADFQVADLAFGQRAFHGFEGPAQPVLRCGAAHAVHSAFNGEERCRRLLRILRQGKRSSQQSRQQCPPFRAGWTGVRFASEPFEKSIVAVRPCSACHSCSFWIYRKRYVPYTAKNIIRIISLRFQRRKSATPLFYSGLV